MQWLLFRANDKPRLPNRIISPEMASTNSSEPPKPVLQIWKKGEVQVFDEPNVLAPPKGMLPPGARVTRYEDAGSFYRIEYRGMSGYVYKDFCEIVE